MSAGECLVNFDGMEIGRGFQPVADLRDSDRLAKTVALHGMHTGRAQEKLLVGGFDSLGGHLHPETAAQADNGMDNGGRIGGLFDRAHETAVDLELVEREASQVK